MRYSNWMAVGYVALEGCTGGCSSLYPWLLLACPRPQSRSSLLLRKCTCRGMRAIVLVCHTRVSIGCRCTVYTGDFCRCCYTLGPVTPKQLLWLLFVLGLTRSPGQIGRIIPVWLIIYTCILCYWCVSMLSPTSSKKLLILYENST